MDTVAILVSLARESAREARKYKSRDMDLMKGYCEGRASAFLNAARTVQGGRSLFIKNLVKSWDAQAVANV